MEAINDAFRFYTGDFECLVIRDTISPMELEFLFSNTPVERLRQVLSQHRIRPGKIMDVMCLFVKTHDHNVLIDTGWGAGPNPDMGKLVENLRRQKIQPEDIDTIIISHGHPDHIGGITDKNNRLVFPNARYYMLKKGWEFWTSGPDLTRFGKDIAHTMSVTAQNNLAPIKDRLTLIDGDAEIMPGFEYIFTPGHSPDHAALLISSHSRKLLYSSDLFHHPLQLARPDIGTAMDFAPQQALEYRMKILGRIAADKMTVFACHFPFPGVGNIVSAGDTFLWQPVEKSNFKRRQT